MKKSQSIFIIVAGALLVTCFGGGYYLFTQFGGRMKDEAKIVRADVEAFAPTTDNAGCVAEVPNRYAEGSEVTSMLKQTMFLSGCLRLSKPTPGFCDDVPAARDVLDSQKWQKEQCAQEKRTNLRCPLVASAIQQHCSRRG
jgi:hypothetical protein